MAEIEIDYRSDADRARFIAQVETELDTVIVAIRRLSWAPRSRGPLGARSSPYASAATAAQPTGPLLMMTDPAESPFAAKEQGRG